MTRRTIDLPPRANRSLVEIEPPAAKHRDAFLAAVARSRRLHGRWVAAPGDDASYRDWLGRARRDDYFPYLVSRRDDGALVGVVNVGSVVRGLFQSAYLGYYALAPNAGRGLMRQGLALVVDRCFGDLELHRVEANVQPENVRSSALVLGLGFRLEGYSPRYLKIAGRWRDHERYALLAEEWRRRTD
ncbi:MAG: GNAT family N-acetyltransferase [Planctomycetota bacterium]